MCEGVSKYTSIDTIQMVSLYKVPLSFYTLWYFLVKSIYSRYIAYVFRIYYNRGCEVMKK